VISEVQRLQYLEAMGIEAWISSEHAVNRVANDRVFYELGPGLGQTLLLCSRQEETALPIAGDIARCLIEAPVWGWQSAGTAGQSHADNSVSLEHAIQDRLFTRVLLCSVDFNGSEADQEEVIGSARIIHAPPLAQLAVNPAQKRRLWQQLNAHGWCSRRG